MGPALVVMEVLYGTFHDGSTGSMLVPLALERSGLGSQSIVYGCILMHAGKKTH